MEITESDYLMNLPTVFDVNEVRLLGGVFRIQDLLTGTIWTHLDGKAIAGPLVGHRLKMVPTPHAPGHQGLVEVREHGNGDGPAP